MKLLKMKHNMVAILNYHFTKKKKKSLTAYNYQWSHWNTFQYHSTPLSKWDSRLKKHGQKMEKNQYQEWFFDNSGNGCQKSDPDNPYTCILDQYFIALSSKVIGLKSMQNFGQVRYWWVKGSFSYKRGFSRLNFERGLKKNYGLPNLETLCSYYYLLETATVLILCKNIESFLRYDCSKWDMLFSQR